MKGFVKLIADSGSTKTEWCLIKPGKKKLFTTQGMSPYFVNEQQIDKIIREEVLPFLKKEIINEVFFLWNRL